MPNIVKITTLPNPLDLLAPHSCRGCGCTGKPLCDCCKNYIVKSLERPKAPLPLSQNYQKILDLLPPNQFFALARRESLVGELIYTLKFNSSRALAQPLADLMHQALPNWDDNIVVVPLPTNTKHVRERGLDHTYLIAKQFTRLRGKNYQVRKILTRQNNTVQVGASQKLRETQAKNAYGLNRKAKIHPQTTYLLLDDILTTGASMQAAIKKLQQAGATKIISVVLAVS